MNSRTGITRGEPVLALRVVLGVIYSRVVAVIEYLASTGAFVVWRSASLGA